MVEYKAPVDLIAGVSAGFNSGLNTNTLTGFVGWDIIPERIGFGSQIPGTDYSWNKSTGLITLLKEGDTFQANERWHFEFQIRFTGSAGGQLNYNAGTVKQYPHTLLVKAANWATSTNGILTYMCRREGGAGAKKGFNGDSQGVNYVVYMPLPVATIEIGTPVEVYSDENELYAADSIKQFSRGQLNVRAWI